MYRFYILFGNQKLSSDLYFVLNFLFSFIFLNHKLIFLMFFFK